MAWVLSNIIALITLLTEILSLSVVAKFYKSFVKSTTLLRWLTQFYFYGSAYRPYLSVSKTLFKPKEFVNAGFLRFTFAAFDVVLK